MRSVKTTLGLLLAIGAWACEGSGEAPSEVREPGLGEARRNPPEPAPADPGPHTWRPRASEDAVPPTGVGASGASSHGRRRTPTKAEIQARFAALRAVDTDASSCRQAFEALRETREGMGELLEEDAMGGPNRADYLALCSALPPEVQRCMTPGYHAAHRQSCEATLARFGADRGSPAWLENLTGRPGGDRPAPATSEAEARALRRRRDRVDPSTPR